jgi:hypothetical protein
MRCEASRVELLGWDSLYTVHLRRAPLTWAASTLPWTRGHATREQRAAYPSVNLAEWSRAVSIGSSDTTALAIRGAPQRFLLIVEVEVDSTQTCMYDVHTTVVDRTPGPRGVPKRTLFDGKADMECGE